MRHSTRIIGVVVLTLGAWLQAADKGGAKSEWVYEGPDGKLQYKTLPTGDRIMDFSSAGYKGGGVAIPKVRVVKTLSPSGGDDSPLIQAAIDDVAKSAPDPATGFRGAVLLQPGKFNVRTSLLLTASGIVLRGSGSSTAGTILIMTGDPHVCIAIPGPAHADETNSLLPLADTYIPSGALSVQVKDASTFKAGDEVVISRPATAAWIRFMGMADLVRNDKKETWIAEESTTRTERTVVSVLGDTVLLDAPLTDSFDPKFVSPPGATISKITHPSRISNVGIESLRIVSPAQSITITQRQHQALRLANCIDCWVKDVQVDDTVNSIGVGGSRITLDHVCINHTVPTQGAAKPADFGAGGSQILFNQCSGSGDNIFYFATGARVTGPIVMLNCVFHGNGHIQPHQRWATGLLIDNCSVPESGIDLMNRGQMGSGHGWAIGWSVAWNCTARTFLVQQPPGSMNWAIGCIGEEQVAPMPFGKAPQAPNLPQGAIDSPGVRVMPHSLYLAQLRDRLGPEALKQIGY